jgi:voltage-gated potassium channel
VWRFVAVVFRVVAIGGASASEGRSILRRHAAGFALAVAGLTWLTSAVGFTLVEDVGVNGRLHSFFDALWWSSATITTVGYGDVYPVTAAGRMIGVVTMVVGISTFAVLTAKVAEFLVRSRQADDIAQQLPANAPDPERRAGA